MGSLILIADPEPETRAFLKTLLEREGYHVCLGEDTDNAVEQFSSTQPDLIIMDALLPGDSASRLIRCCENCPVIVTSALSMKSLFFRHPLFEFLFHPQASGCPVPFLEKPVQEDELFRLIHGLIPGGTPEKPPRKG